MKSNVELEKTVKEENFRFAPSDKIFLNERCTYVNLPKGSDKYFIMRGTIDLHEGKWYRIDYEHPKNPHVKVRNINREIMEIVLDNYYRIPDGFNRLYISKSENPFRLVVSLSDNAKKPE